MSKKQKEVAVYKGDTFIYVGTVKECATHLNVKPETIQYYLTDSYARKLAKRKNSECPLESFS